MASWMVHLRIADKLLDEINEIDKEAFIIGNIAPDSGVPNEDWSRFKPSKDISHFYIKDEIGDVSINDNEFINKYFTKEKRKKYNIKKFSFYLGYLVHLWSDQLWKSNVYESEKKRFSKFYEENINKFIWTLKEDWYDLDMLYLKNKPNFRAFTIYEEIKSFKNNYMDEFSEDAFENRQKYIVNFYRTGKEGIDREYKYMTEEDMNTFVDTSIKIIRSRIINKKLNYINS